MPDYHLTAEGFVSRAYFAGPRRKVETLAAALAVPPGRIVAGPRRSCSFGIDGRDRVTPEAMDAAMVAWDGVPAARHAEED